jgi:hypothetical protein
MSINKRNLIIFNFYNSNLLSEIIKMLNIVLMGASKARKTSMAKVIFQKMVAKQTQLLSETTKV